jgi:hypothetical protein
MLRLSGGRCRLAASRVLVAAELEKLREELLRAGSAKTDM